MSSQTSSEKTMMAKAPRLERGRARVAALLAAGASVFAEKGYESATMTEVAAKAGASIGSLYQFFPTKPLLAEALHLDLLEKLAALMEALGVELAERPAALVVETLFVRFGEFLEANPSFAALADRRDIDPERKKQTRAQMRGLIAALLTGAEPPLPRERAEAASVVVLHLIRAATMLKESDDAPVRDAALAEMRRMLAAYFA